MPQTGAIGVHIEANSQGYSRDIAVANVQQIGGKYCTVVNDALLCLMLLDVGAIPIHRINRAGLLDDNAQQKGYSAREYVRTAAAEVPDKRAPISLNNEPGQNDLERLRDFMLEGIDEANKLGRKLACFNWSYGNPEPATDAVLAPVHRAIASGEHFYCVHEGTDAAHPTLASCYPHRIGRFLALQQKYGFRVLVTEFAASLDAHHGWQTWNSNYAQVCDETVREVYAPNGVYMTPFSLFPWHQGFDYVNSPELKAAWAQTNARYPVEENPVTQPTYPPPTTGGKRAILHQCPNNTYVNIRAQPNPASGNTGVGQPTGELLLNDEVTYYPDAKAGEWVYQTPLNPVARPSPRRAAVAGWVSLQGGAVAFLDALLPPVPEPEGVAYTPAENEAVWAALEQVQVAVNHLRSKLKGAPSDSGGTFPGD